MHFWHNKDSNNKTGKIYRKYKIYKEYVERIYKIYREYTEKIAHVQKSFPVCPRRNNRFCDASILLRLIPI